LITGDSITLDATMAQLAAFMQCKSDDGMMDLLTTQTDLISAEEKSFLTVFLQFPPGVSKRNLNSEDSVRRRLCRRRDTIF